MKSKFNILLYVSLIFLVYALYKGDYLHIPRIVSTGNIIISIGLLFGGFIISGIAWKSILNQFGYKISLKESLAAVGLPIFTKYVPGKVWIIVGRAGYIAERKNLSMKDLSIISLNAQFIALWIGLLYGVSGLLLLRKLQVIGVVVFIAWIFLSLVIFTDVFHKIGEFLISKIVKKDIYIPKLELKTTLRILPWFALQWGVWAVGFYFLAQGLMEQNLPLLLGLGLPLAAAMGILMIIAPGGLGIREGALVAFLVLTGIASADATTIAVTSRIWYLLGEAFIFLLGVIMNEPYQDKSMVKNMNMVQN